MTSPLQHTSVLFGPRHSPILSGRRREVVTRERMQALVPTEELDFRRCVLTNLRPGSRSDQAFPSVENPSSVYWIVTDSRVVLIYPREPYGFEPHERFHIEYRAGWFNVWLSPGWTREFVIEQLDRREGESATDAVARALAQNYLPLMRSRALMFKPLPSLPVGAFQSVSRFWASDTNPWGYDGDNRRLDLPGGGTRWWEAMGQHSIGHGCQGHIIWAFRQHPHGGMYRPDAWREYLLVRAQVREIMGRAAEARQWIGCTIRPAKMVAPDPRSPDTDSLRASEAGDDYAYQAANLQLLVGEGFRHFYVDEPLPVPLIRKLRACVDASVNFFPESSTTEHLPFGGLYHEPGAQTPHNPEWFVWLARLIYPEIPVLFQPRGNKQADEAWRLRYSELVGDWQWKTREPQKATGTRKLELHSESDR